jgi:hypothetical protein
MQAPEAEQDDGDIIETRPYETLLPLQGVRLVGSTACLINN